MQCPECQGIGTIIDVGFDELLYCPGPGGRQPCPTCKGEKSVTPTASAPGHLIKNIGLQPDRPLPQQRQVVLYFPHDSQVNMGMDEGDLELIQTC